MNPLIMTLKKFSEIYEGKLPPLEEREQLWEALANTSNEDILQEFNEYVETNADKIHYTLLGEIGRILYDKIGP